jgi:hypothetical protein
MDVPVEVLTRERDPVIPLWITAGPTVICAIPGEPR